MAKEKETIARASYGALSDNNGRLIESTVESQLNEEFVVDVLNAEHVHNIDGTDVDYTNNCWMLDEEELNDGYPVFKANQN